MTKKISAKQNRKSKRTTEAGKKYSFQLSRVSVGTRQLDCSKPRTRETIVIVAVVVVMMMMMIIITKKIIALSI